VAEILLELPVDVRSELKEPFGPLFTDAETLLAEAGSPLVAVGDIVTYHLLSAGRVPEVALVDDRTQRSAVDGEISDAIGGFDRRLTVRNPPGTLTGELLDALTEALGTAATTLLDVDGEEDLAALPAVLTVPDGASVVYGQPNDGMVLVVPDGATRERVRSLLTRMDGETAAVLGRL